MAKLILNIHAKQINLGSRDLVYGRITEGEFEQISGLERFSILIPLYL